MMRKNKKDDIPLININFLYHSYDDLGRPDDRVKQEVLNEIIKIRTTTAETEATTTTIARNRSNYIAVNCRTRSNYQLK